MMDTFTRRDLAHERFDCDWDRDWQCMSHLLEALECTDAAAKLRLFCGSKKHTTQGGESKTSVTLTRLISPSHLTLTSHVYTHTQTHILPNPRFQPHRHAHPAHSCVPIPHFTLAGDWASQKFLGSMEGAVLSGQAQGQG